MATAIWTILALGAMVGIFGACIVAIVVGVRLLEGVVARRRDRRTA